MCCIFAALDERKDTETKQAFFIFLLVEMGTNEGKKK